MSPLYAVQIIDITDPVLPNAAAAVTHDARGFTTLYAAANIDTVVIGSKTYAVLTYFSNNYAVQIIDITNPGSPNSTSAITDGTDGFTALRGVRGVDTAVIGPKTYAVLAAYDDNGIQIIDITDPASPNATAAVTDGTGGFTTLAGAWDVDTVTIGPRTYAVVAAAGDNGVQIIDITPDATQDKYRRCSGTSCGR